VQQKLELTRRMGAGYEKFRDDPSVQAITKECRAYMDDLKYHHVTDSQVGNQRIGECHGIAHFLADVMRYLARQ